MVTWLITVAGKDQPELLHKFCETIALMEGVFLDKQQTVMAGQVTAMFKVCLPATHVSFARKMFAEYTVNGLEVVSVQEISAEAGAGSHQILELLLEIQGQYRFGIDHDIRTILECHGAQIEQLNQHYVGQTSVGESQFSSTIRAVLAHPISEPDLLQALHRLSPGLNIRISITEHEVVLAS
ncbi:ACT domain-containing protein [Amphritea sp. HPY]|uniref:ACT domain-containing protein n=1 Tax=Amphritea sp. HPY TaxID=3421652 RepID=UPI003D7D6CB6